MEIISSELQTKEWRKSQKWYKNGKSNECEKYQMKILGENIKDKIDKTNDRIYMTTNEIKSNRNPNRDNDGFEYTENFDGKISDENNIYYFNLKFVCENGGGAQTRTLREVYHFIKYQTKYLEKFNTKNIYFINILDGYGCYHHREKFNYLINKNTKDYIFIGDMKEFINSDLINKIK